MSKNGTKSITAYCDGCFDILHYGHANQLRQAKEIADHLVAGIHSDAEITKNKGAPVYHEEERYRLLRGQKWADKVIYDAPFSPTVELLEQYNCDICVHGTDFSLTSDGTHTFEEVNNAGRYVELKRMPGISTTDIIQRVLWLADQKKNETSNITNGEEFRSIFNNSPWTRGHQFILSTGLLNSFSDMRKLLPDDKVVYVAGTFDIFHVGHLAFFEEASKLGTYLLVGVYSDAVVKKRKGHLYPILSLSERVLNVLSYKCVSNVIIGAPNEVSSAILDQFKVDIVCHGTQIPIDPDNDPYLEPKKRGIFRNVDSKCSITTETILKRILSRRSELEERNETKETKERNAFEFVNKCSFKS